MADESKSDADPTGVGLTSEQALRTLWQEINAVVQSKKKQPNKKCWTEWMADVFGSNSPLHWFPMLTTFLCTICLAACGQLVSAGIVAVILGGTAWVVVREHHLKETEILRKIRYVLDDIESAFKLSAEWRPTNYPHLCSPLSPCVTLQWTYRDGEIVNLPWSLLVKGDYVVMRPGQSAPGNCVEVGGTKRFASGETYSLNSGLNPPVRPTARVPLKNLICVMEVTPYLENLAIAIDHFLDKPHTIHNQQRHLLISVIVQKWASVLAVAMCLVAGLFNATDLIISRRSIAIEWRDAFILYPVAVALPILPLLFPVVWTGLNLWGLAKLETLLAIPKPFVDCAESPLSFDEDLDTPPVDWDNMRLPFRWNVGNFLQLVGGSAHLLGRSAHVVQVLGSVTTLTCVDKKGILSWPNPTAEKIFFLHDAATGTERDTDTDQVSNSTVENSESVVGAPAAATAAANQATVAEVLDLTHDQHSPFKLVFDDHEWDVHLNSLKPLGLAILVNTCCPLTQAYYAKFCGHVTAVSLFDKDLVPVTNRYAIVESSLNSFMHGRCLCELAKQIGFSKQARDIFSLEGKIACYRHLQPDVVRRDIRFARSLQISSKVKVPFPHSLSVVMREMAGTGQSLQLLTQGTADIILDCCDDFWDGQDLQPLRPQDRKRAQDFYQRNALTAYCTAFAYRPLRHGIVGALSGSQEQRVAYLELPAESKQRMEHDTKFKCDFDGGGDRHSRHHGHRRRHQMSHSISTDSLLFNDAKEEDVSDVDGCFEMQCHQVFIGMVTMQYQAQTDIVQLIERLERACVRFVHFSKENELRSRVFSEKLGLESGWNCHISLCSDDDDLEQVLHSPKGAGSQQAQHDYRFGSVNDLQLKIDDQELDACLLKQTTLLDGSKNLSSSAPGGIADAEDSSAAAAAAAHLNQTEKDSLLDPNEHQQQQHNKSSSTDDSLDNTSVGLNDGGRSTSCLTDSTEQSVPVHFDMSNRAKLPRGIENIRPHLENVDNVPLQVSLFTDCSAEATKEMLKIMQSYGEVVICLGSSANATNVEIFLQADCSIGIEPLYPQVCQDYPAYTEANIYHNKKAAKQEQGLYKWFTPTANKNNKTISPIYLSRTLNSICSSTAVCRDDPLSLVALIELSRRFTIGLWNCVQFLVCCGCTVAVINLLSVLLTLPPLFPPLTVLYLLCVAVPLLSTSLARISSDPRIMAKATGKKSTKIGSRLIMYVVWCYGMKFLPLIVFMIFSYSAFMVHPVYTRTLDEDFKDNLKLAQAVSLFAIVLHFVIVSASFVHRDFLFWRRNALQNKYWLYSALALVSFHVVLLVAHIFLDDDIEKTLADKWPVMVFILCSAVLTFFTTELCKWQEIKANSRYQRRARLDFGTKLGMNSPF